MAFPTNPQIGDTYNLLVVDNGGNIRRLNASFMLLED